MASITFSVEQFTPEIFPQLHLFPSESFVGKWAFFIKLEEEGAPPQYIYYALAEELILWDFLRVDKLFFACRPVRFSKTDGFWYLTNKDTNEDRIDLSPRLPEILYLFHLAVKRHKAQARAKSHQTQTVFVL